MRNLKKILSTTFMTGLMALSFNVVAQEKTWITLEEVESMVKKDEICENVCGVINQTRVVSYDKQEKVINIKLSVTANKKSLVLTPFTANTFEWKQIKMNGSPFNLVSVEDNKVYFAVNPGVHEFEIALRIKTSANQLLGSLNDLGFFESNVSNVVLTNINNQLWLNVEDEVASVKVDKEEEKSSNTNIKGESLYEIRRVMSLKDIWKVRTIINPILVGENKDYEVRVPLLKDEKIFTENIEQKDGFAILQMRGNPVVFESAVPTVNYLEFKNIENAKNSILKIDITNSGWLYDFKGLNPIQMQSNRNGERFVSWILGPKDILSLDLRLPQVVDGKKTIVAKVNVNHVLANDKSETQTNVRAVIESVVGGNYKIKIDDTKYKVEKIEVNGATIELQQGELNLFLKNGENNVSIDFKTLPGQDEYTLKKQVPEIIFEGDVYNYHVNIKTNNHWVLFSSKSQIGNIVLLPGIVAFVMILGVLLGKTYLNKYGVLSVSLIVFGLIQVGMFWLAVFLTWLALFVWKEKNIMWLIEKNKLQIYNKAIIGSTVFAGLILLYGLLAGLIWANPSIYISGISSNGDFFMSYEKVNLYSYYHQLEGNVLPYIVALPISTFSFVMLGWSIFMVLFITKWVKWMWSIFKLEESIQKD